ncbi:MAG: kinase-like domain-containing protein, partial [Linnemannia gamsii]
CIVMKHCMLGNLVTFLDNNKDSLTWSERYRISIEITKGLEFLHKSGFHHRDLHSGNILLDDKRTAMICDFGLSRESNKGQTSDLGATVGVAPFLAPERFPIPRPVYTAACDIYSLGVIFWHISSGKIPFVKRLKDPKLLHELMEGHREQIVEGTPWDFQELIVKCWDKDATLRPQIDNVIGVLQ